MCLVRIGRKIKNGFVWLIDRSYKTITGFLFLLWMIGVLLNPPLTLVFTAIWWFIQGTLIYSWNKTRDAADWTLSTVWQQVKHWREGRRRYSVARREEEYGK